MRKLNAQQLATGVVTGIVAGIAVAIILGLYQLASDLSQRQYQIHYVSEMVSDGIERIRETNKNEERLLYYNRMLRELEDWLKSEESSEIRYSEKRTLRNALPYHIDGRVMFLTLTRLPPQPDEFFKTALEQFQGIDWLTLRSKADL